MRGLVYWLPPPGMAAGDAVGAVSVVPLLLNLTACARVAVRGLRFAAGDTAVLVANCTDVGIEACEFTGQRTTAVHAHAAANANVSVADNVIRHTGSFSIWLNGGASAPPLTWTNVSATGNIILNFGRLEFVFNPAIGLDGAGSVARHNLIAGGPACGIMFGGARQRVEHNIIMDALVGAAVSLDNKKAKEGKGKRRGKKETKKLRKIDE